MIFNEWLGKEIEPAEKVLLSCAPPRTSKQASTQPETSATKPGKLQTWLAVLHQTPGARNRHRPDTQPIESSRKLFLEMDVSVSLRYRVNFSRARASAVVGQTLVCGSASAGPGLVPWWGRLQSAARLQPGPGRCRGGADFSLRLGFSRARAGAVVGQTLVCGSASAGLGPLFALAMLPPRA